MLVLNENFILALCKAFGRSVPNELKSRAFQSAAAKLADETSQFSGVEFIVYYGEKRADNHISMWDPVFSPLEGKYKSVIRYSGPWWNMVDKKSALPVAGIGHCDLIFSRMPDLKAVFYPSNNGVNLQAVRNTRYQHIFLGHGDSNKASSANKVFRLYDEVWVAGEAHKDRFSKISGNFDSIDFRTVGQPWMATWLKARPEYRVEDMNCWGYFPTWTGYYEDTNYSSLQLLQEVVNASEEHGKGWVKPHPWTSKIDIRRLKESEEDCEAFHLVPRTEQLREVLRKPLRFVISDVSGALTECLYIGVPIFLFRPSPPTQIDSDFERVYNYCYIFRDARELRSLLTRVIVDGDDYLASSRKEAISYLVDLNKTYNSAINEEFLRLSEI